MESVRFTFYSSALCASLTLVANSARPLQCPDGKYVEDNYPDCFNCPPGKTSGPTNHGTCVDCPAGTWSSDGDTCHDCPSGTYSTQGQAKVPITDCLPCQSGTYSTGTSSSANPAVYSTLCSYCESGKYQWDVGQGECLYCAEGSYSGPKAMQCMQCEPGKTSYATDATGTNVIYDPNTPYPDGTSGPTTCTKCSAGKTTTTSAVDMPGTPVKGLVCQDCQNGTYSEAGDFPCTFCGVSETYGPGTYSGKGASFCPMCPAGKKSEEGNTFCSNCTWGYYSLEGAEICTPCQPGKYSNITGSSMCMDCPENTKQSKAGAYTCEVCEAGKTSGGGDVICSSCPKGTYSDPASKAEGGTAGECWACGEGKAVKNNRCQNCEVGRYSTQPAEYEAEVDYSTNGPKSGYYGNYYCSYCDEGYDTANRTGVTSCTACPKGKYKLEPNAACEFCEAGKRTGMLDGAEATEAASYCVSCTPGKRSGPGNGPANTGAVNCIDCEAGRYSNIDRSFNCTNCDAGYFSESGKTFCDPCR